MKFLADENFPMPSARLLRELGHDVMHINGRITVFDPPRVRQRPFG
ncbi:MAG: DUF5615 family PIN-like protein [Flavobacteriales bacterium]|nr:DUF5615 family PIN-like protein [Flavobacteriales bacterium]